MIMNKMITSQPIRLIKATSDSVAVLLISVANISMTDKTLILYVVEFGKSVPVYNSSGNLISGNEDTYFLQKTISSKNSLLIEEKLLLGPGDAIYANCIEDDTSLVATISYEVY